MGLSLPVMRECDKLVNYKNGTGLRKQYMKWSPVNILLEGHVSDYFLLVFDKQSHVTVWEEKNKEKNISIFSLQNNCYHNTFTRRNANIRPGGGVYGAHKRPPRRRQGGYISSDWGESVLSSAAEKTDLSHVKAWKMGFGLLSLCNTDNEPGR